METSSDTAIDRQAPEVGLEECMPCSVSQLSSTGDTDVVIGKTVEENTEENKIGDKTDSEEPKSTLSRPTGNEDINDQLVASHTEPSQTADTLIATAEDIENVVPTVENVVPTIENVVTTVENAVPTIENVVPTVENAVPTVENVVPTVDAEGASTENAKENVGQSLDSVNHLPAETDTSINVGGKLYIDHQDVDHQKIDASYDEPSSVNTDDSCLGDASKDQDTAIQVFPVSSDCNVVENDYIGDTVDSKRLDRLTEKDTLNSDDQPQGIGTINESQGVNMDSERNEFETNDNDEYMDTCENVTEEVDGGIAFEIVNVRSIQDDENICIGKDYIVSCDPEDTSACGNNTGKVVTESSNDIAGLEQAAVTGFMKKTDDMLTNSVQEEQCSKLSTDSTTALIGKPIISDINQESEKDVENIESGLIISSVRSLSEDKGVEEDIVEKYVSKDGTVNVDRQITQLNNSAMNIDSELPSNISVKTSYNDALSEGLKENSHQKDKSSLSTFQGNVENADEYGGISSVGDKNLPVSETRIPSSLDGYATQQIDINRNIDSCNNSISDGDRNQASPQITIKSQSSSAYISGSSTGVSTSVANQTTKSAASSSSAAAAARYVPIKPASVAIVTTVKSSAITGSPSAIAMVSLAKSILTRDVPENISGRPLAISSTSPGRSILPKTYPPIQTVYGLISAKKAFEAAISLATTTASVSATTSSAPVALASSVNVGANIHLPVSSPIDMLPSSSPVDTGLPVISNIFSIKEEPLDDGVFGVMPESTGIPAAAVPLTEPNVTVSVALGSGSGKASISSVISRLHGKKISPSVTDVQNAGMLKMTKVNVDDMSNAANAHPKALRVVRIPVESSKQQQQQQQIQPQPIKVITSADKIAHGIEYAHTGVPVLNKQVMVLKVTEASQKPSIIVTKAVPDISNGTVSSTSQQNSVSFIVPGQNIPLKVVYPNGKGPLVTNTHMNSALPKPKQILSNESEAANKQAIDNNSLAETNSGKEVNKCGDKPKESLDNINTHTVGYAKIAQIISRVNPMPMFKPEPIPDHLRDIVESTTHQCYECGDTFNLSKSLKIHQNRCSMRLQYKCPKCLSELTFTNKCQLLRHLRSHLNIPKTQGVPIHIKSDSIHIRTVYNEIGDGKDFQWYDADKCHIDKNEDNCVVCQTDFDKHNKKSGHFKRLLKPFEQCDKCDMYLPNKCSLVLHKRLHNLFQYSEDSLTEGDMLCPDCGLHESDTNKFWEHVFHECRHPARQLSWTCYKCKLSLQSKLEVGKHLLAKLENYYKCSKCPMALKTLSSFMTHYKQKHGELTDLKQQVKMIYRCHLCDTLIDDRSFLMTHLDNHVEIFELEANFHYFCEYCPQKRTSLYTYEHHIRKEHYELLSFTYMLTKTCSCCKKMFKDPLCMYRHYKDTHVHMTSQVFVKFCECGCVCTHEKALNKHLCLNTLTLKALSSPKALDRDVRSSPPSVVSGDSYLCPLCSRNIPMNSRISHIQHHRSKKQYICVGCDSIVFADNHSLRCHEVKCLEGSISKHRPIAPKLPKNLNKSIALVPVFPINLKESKPLMPELPNNMNNSRPLVPEFPKDLNKNRPVVPEFPRNLNKSRPLVPEFSENLNKSRQLVPKFVNKSFKCPLCDYYISSEAILKSHHVYHRKLEEFFCVSCLRVDFADYHEYRSHEIGCRPLVPEFPKDLNKNRPVVPEFPRNLNKSRPLVPEFPKNLNKSRQLVPKFLNKSFMCPLCDYYISSEAILKSHHVYHRKLEEFFCVTCLKVDFADYHEYRSHEIGCKAIQAKMISDSTQKKKVSPVIVKNKKKLKVIKMKKYSDNSLHATDTGDYMSSDSEAETEEGLGKVRLSLKGVEKEKRFIDRGERFKCTKCSQEFTRKSKLDEHMDAEHSLHSCHLCGIMYESLSRLKVHLYIHHKGKKLVYYCWVCRARKIDKSYIEKSFLEKHLSQKHRMKSWDPARIVPELPVSDKEGVSPEPQILECLKNQSVALDEPPVKKLKVEGDMMFNCAKCSFTCDNKSSFKEHINEHNTENTVQCLECGLCFAVLPSLRRHLFMVHKIRDFDLYVQENCIEEPEELDNLDYIEREEVRITEPVESSEEEEGEEEEGEAGNELECKVCYKQFETKHSLTQHMRVHGMAFIKKSRRRVITSRQAAAMNTDDPDGLDVASSEETEETPSKKARIDSETPEQGHGLKDEMIEDKKIENYQVVKNNENPSDDVVLKDLTLVISKCD